MPSFNGDDIIFPIDGPLGRNGYTFAVNNFELFQFIGVFNMMVLIKNRWQISGFQGHYKMTCSGHAHMHYG